MPQYQIARNTDLIDNPSPRCPCMVVLDTSGSMNGHTIQELNSGFELFLKNLRDDDVAAYSVEVSVITAGDRVHEHIPFTIATNIDIHTEFQASGVTPLGGAVEMALDRLESRKNDYKKNGVAYYQPWLIIISDGAPTDNWQAAAKRAESLSAAKKLVSLPIGVSNADMSILGQFSSRPAIKLQGIRFSDFFSWLSASMSRVSASASTTSSVPLPAIDGWGSI